MVSIVRVVTQSISKRKGIMKITKTIKAAALAALAVMTVSCEQEISFKSKDTFQFSVKAEGPVMTKSDVSVETENVDLSFDDVKVTLTATATPMVEDSFASFNTKAVAINDANDENFTQFNMSIKGIASDVKVVKDGGNWAIDRSAGKSYKWPEDITSGGIQFDSYWGKGATFSGNTVSYTMTDSDLLIGRTYADKNMVPVTLYHPLAALRFKVAGFQEGFEVTNIKLSTLCTTGSFTIPEGGEVNKAMDISSFAWSNLSGAQDLNTDVYDGADEFFIIPQTATGVTMTITFQQEGGPEKTLEVEMPTVGLVGGSWQAGYYYTYTISGGGYVEIEASDKMDGVATSDTGETKTDVRANNTGSLETYVRAYVVTNWYNAAGKVVAPYTGEISYNTSAWTYNEADGFYYHNSAVPADASTDNLIHSFTPQTSAAPAKTGFELHAEMQVIFQAVEVDKAGDVWSYYNAR